MLIIVQSLVTQNKKPKIVEIKFTLKKDPSKEDAGLPTGNSGKPRGGDARRETAEDRKRKVIEILA